MRSKAGDDESVAGRADRTIAPFRERSDHGGLRELDRFDIRTCDQLHERPRDVPALVVVDGSQHEGRLEDGGEGEEALLVRVEDGLGLESPKLL